MKDIGNSKFRQCFGESIINLQINKIALNYLKKKNNTTVVYTLRKRRQNFLFSFSLSVSSKY